MSEQPTIDMLAAKKALEFVESIREELTTTYEIPVEGWVCFHCGERFMTLNRARDHFGPTPGSMTACQLGPEGIRRELRRLRSLEAEWDVRVGTGNG